jgi:putative acetyltransferase
MELTFRKATLDDLNAIQEIFVNTITHICAKDYDPDQIQVWTNSIKDKQRWIEKINAQFFLIAEKNSEIVGFASLENGDYLDFLYIHHEHQNQGIATALMNALLKESVRRGASMVRSDVSITAKPFFQKAGFTTIRKQIRERDDVALCNFLMEKKLIGDDERML